MIRQSLIVVALLTMFAGFALASDAPSNRIDPPRATPQQGQYYRYELPQGWIANETPLIVEMTSSDGWSTAAAGFIAGEDSSPIEVIHKMLKFLPGEDARIVATKDLSDGMIEVEWTFTLDGRQMKGAIACNTVQGMGAMIAVIQCPLESYFRDGPAMRTIAGSVNPTSQNAGRPESKPTSDAPEAIQKVITPPSQPTPQDGWK